MKNKILKQNSFKEAVLIIAIFEGLSKIVNFLRNIVIAAYYGFSRLNDVFNFSNSIIFVPLGLLSDALLAGVIPYLTKKTTEDEKSNFIYSLIIVLFAIFLLIFFVLFLFFNSLIVILAPGFDPSDYPMIKMFCLGFAFITTSTVYTKVIEGYFRSKNIFGFANITNFVSSMISLLVLVLFIEKNYFFLIYSLVISAVVSMGIYLYFSPKVFNRFDFEVVSLLKFSFPLVLSGSLGMINTVVDKSFATLLGAGSLTALNYSFMLIMALYGVIIGSLGGASYSFIAKDISENRLLEVRERSLKLSNLYVTVLSIIIGAFILLGQPIYQLLFLWGKVTVDNIWLLYSITLVYFPMILFNSIGNTTAQIYYSYGQSKVPTLVNGIFILLHILINYCTVGLYGAYALAGSTLIVSMFATLTNVHLINKNFNIQILQHRHLLIMMYVVIYALFGLLANGIVYLILGFILLLVLLLATGIIRDNLKAYYGGSK